jgi:hypothetical protein
VWVVGSLGAMIDSMRPSFISKIVWFDMNNSPNGISQVRWGTEYIDSLRACVVCRWDEWT